MKKIRQFRQKNIKHKRAGDSPPSKGGGTFLEAILVSHFFLFDTSA